MPEMRTGQRRRGTSHSPWPLEELVRAQCTACEGDSFEEIAQALGRSLEDVRLRLDPQPAPGRQEFAHVGYRQLKDR